MADPRSTDPRSAHSPHRGTLPPKEPPSEPTVPPTTTAADTDSGELRARVDRGETGDKVDYHDPATAPLGTDSEAGGNPMPTQKMEGVSRYGAVNPARPGGAEDQQRAGYAPSGRRQVSTIVWAAIVLILIVLALVVFL